MIIVEVNGGLGNQLQQYAMYEKLKSLGKEVKLDLSWYSRREMGKATRRELELDYFPNVTYEACIPEEKQKILGSSSFLAKALRKLHLTPNRRYTEHQMYDTSVFDLDNCVMAGYWACEGYYRDILPALRRKLTFPVSDNPANQSMKERMGDTNSVSLHLRRGDYLEPVNQELYGGICTDAYYGAAIRYIKERVENPVFYIFSDDPDYAGEYVSKITGQQADSIEFEIVNLNHGKDSFFDMELMSNCRCHICANSTFSFWGARLNGREDRIAIRPLKQRNNVDWYEPSRMKGLWQNWVCIDEEGAVRAE